VKSLNEDDRDQVHDEASFYMLMLPERAPANEIYQLPTNDEIESTLAQKRINKAYNAYLRHEEQWKKVMKLMSDKYNEWKRSPDGAPLLELTPPILTALYEDLIRPREYLDGANRMISDLSVISTKQKMTRLRCEQKYVVDEAIHRALCDKESRDAFFAYLQTDHNLTVLIGAFRCYSMNNEYKIEVNSDYSKPEEASRYKYVERSDVKWQGPRIGWIISHAPSAAKPQ